MGESFERKARGCGSGACGCAGGNRAGNLGQFRAVIFDFDGTLALGSSYDFDAMRERVALLARDYGVEVDPAGLVLELVERVEGLLARQNRGRALEFRRRAARIIEELELRGASSARINERTARALRALRAAGFRIAVVTRNGRKAVKLILRGRELPCHVLLCRESVNRVKPDPEHLLRALSRLRRKSHEAIMVGDQPTDMQAGRAVGMRTVGVLSGAGNRDSLLAAGADEVVPDVTALASELLRAKGRAGIPKRRGASDAKAAGLPLSRSRSR